MTDPLDGLMAAVRESAKYCRVSEELVRSIGERELAKGRSAKEAVKATKNKLHQVGGAYQPRAIDYPAALTALKEARCSADPAAWRQACARVMAQHASTRERLPILEQFYSRLLANLGPIRSVLDLACGLNPLAIPWMPLAEDVEYHACDIYGDMVEFLNECLALAGARGCAHVTDVTHSCPADHVDVALLLKSLPCLEQIDPTVGPRLLSQINANVLIVSFPMQSLGGRRRWMAESHEAHLIQWAAQSGWQPERFDFGAEVAFRFERPGSRCLDKGRQA